MKIKWLSALTALAVSLFAHQGYAQIQGFPLGSVISPSSTIPVCWENIFDSTELQRSWVKNAVARTWEANSAVRFSGWGQCEEGASGVRIAVRDEGPYTLGLGTRIFGVANGMVLNFTYDNWNSWCKASAQSCSEVSAVHEFGHALGFAHEQNRPDTPSTCTEPFQGSSGDTLVGAWDLYSVMNYCHPDWRGKGTLSQTDIDMVQRFYGGAVTMEMKRWATGLGGFWDTQKWLVGDFNGDHIQDMANIFNEGGNASIDVYLSNGSGLFTYRRWATRQGGYWDAQKWLAGDFNGDGIDDLAKVFNDGGSASIDVHLSTGSIFNMQRWATRQGGYWDAQQWLAGDFNGDRIVDLAKAFSDGSLISIDAHLSNAAGKFNMYRWTTQQGSFSTSQRWLAGDFNGDGFDDLAKVWNDSGAATIDVHKSTSSSFTMQRWATKQGAFDSKQQWRSGDFNGDGADDFAKSFTDAGLANIDVHLSTRSTFAMQRWANRQGSFSDNQKWMAGNFNGGLRTELAKAFNDAGKVSIDVHLIKTP